MCGKKVVIIFKYADFNPPTVYVLKFCKPFIVEIQNHFIVMMGQPVHTYYTYKKDL